MTNIRDLRVPYSYDGNLTLNDVTIKTWDPFELFQTWMEDAVKEPSIKQPNKMVIATCSQGWHSLRNSHTPGSRSYNRTSFKKNVYRDDLKSDWMTKSANYHRDFHVL